MEFICCYSDVGADGEVITKVIPSAWRNGTGEAGGIGHGEAEAFFDHAAEVGEHLELGFARFVF